MTFSVAFTGDINPNVDKSDVVQKLMGLFKKDQVFIEKLLAGNKVVIKRQLDHETARKYQTAIMKAGAFTCIIDDDAEQTAAPVKEPKVTTGQDTDTGERAADMSMAQAGEILVAAEKVAEPQIDISGFDLAQAGETIVEPQPQVNYQSETASLLEMAETGATLVESKKTQPANIETDHLSMSKPGADILDTDQGNSD